MGGVKILHTADNHLDPKLRIFGGKMYDRKKDFQESFGELVRYAQKHRPHIMLISGDLFDSVNPRNPTRTFVIKSLRALKNIGVKIFVIAGNHDSPKSMEEGMSPICELEAAGLVKFFSNLSSPQAEHVQINNIDVCISGLSYDPSLGFNENVRISTKIPTEGDLNIALLHYNLDTMSVPDIWRTPTIRVGDIPKDLHYLALGHLHGFQKIRIGKTVAIYPGSTERRTFFEENDSEKGFVWIEFNEKLEINWKFVEVNSRPMKTIKVRLSESIEDPLKEIMRHVGDTIDRDLILRLKVSGRLPLNLLTKYKRKEILERLSGKFFYVIVDDKDLGYLPKEQKIRDEKVMLSPIEAFRVYANKMLEEAKSDEEKEILRRALKYGLKVLEEVGAW